MLQACCCICLEKGCSYSCHKQQQQHGPLGNPLVLSLGYQLFDQSEQPVAHTEQAMWVGKVIMMMM